MKNSLIAFALLIAFTSCKKKESSTTEEPTPTTTGTPACPTCNFPDTVYTSTATGPKLIFKFKMDSTQVRLNNFGQPTVVASGNAAQSPKFNGISGHYIELAKGDSVPVGGGVVLYRAEETTCGGSNAIVFCKSIVAKEGDVFFSVPLSQVAAGSYKWLRVSLAYQNYNIKIHDASAGNINGTIASFVGFNTYVTKYKMQTSATQTAVMTPTAGGGPGNHPQGYWGLYTKLFSTDYFFDGQAAKTTVVNPINASSPIPAGSCLVTGQFYKTSLGINQPLVITGTETSDIIITVSLSTNKSFEWVDTNPDGLFQPAAGETVVDMGLRGVIAKY